MGPHFLCFLCANEVDHAAERQMPTCPCRFCLPCLQGALKSQVLSQIQSLPSGGEIAASNAKEGSIRTRLLQQDNLPEMKASAKVDKGYRRQSTDPFIILECPGCCEEVSVSSMVELIEEELQLWYAVSGYQLSSVPLLERASEISRESGDARDFQQPESSMARRMSRDESESMRTFSCQFCSESFSKDVMCLIPTCGCRICFPCVYPLLVSQLEAGFSETLDNDRCLDCPVCSCIVPVTDVREMIPDAFRWWNEERRSEKFLSEQPLQACPSCGMLSLREASTIPEGKSSGELDDKGRPLSEASIRHKAAHRFPCPQCDSNYCGSCSTVPYHLRRTCEEHARFLESPPCRFCGEVVVQKAEVKTGQGDPATVHGKVASSPAKGLWGRLMGRMPKNADPQIGNAPCVCDEEECQNKAREACTRKHEACGHLCGGLLKESECLPCLKEVCLDSGPESLPGNKKLSSYEDLCPICVADSLGSAPAILLHCGHVVHASCAKEMVQRGFPGPELTFRYLECPTCQSVMKHTSLDEAMKEGLTLKAKVTEHIDGRLKELKKKFQSADEESEAKADMLRQSWYFQCEKCKQPFHGGERECGQGDNEDNAQSEEKKLCEQCSFAQWSGEKTCTKGHGDNYIQYKCRYCCSPAVWFCWGTTHFCDKCHTDFIYNRGTLGQRDAACKGGPECPLQVPVHPAPGKEFLLGCGLCRTGNAS